MSGTINWNNTAIALAASHSPSDPNVTTAFSAGLNAASPRQRTPAAVPKLNATPFDILKVGTNSATLKQLHWDTVLEQIRDPNFSPCVDMTDKETKQRYYERVSRMSFQPRRDGPIERCGSYRIGYINGTPRIVRTKDGRE
jgi:hypothetical protein